jgi:hypothetical protein
MKRLALTLVIIMATAGQAFAIWQLYKEDSKVVANFNYDSFAPFRGKPSVWVKWQYTTPMNGVAGKKLQFTADCSARKLFEIAVIPFDADGNYLQPNEHFDAPMEYPLTPGSLNEATYNLLCH